MDIRENSRLDGRCRDDARLVIGAGRIGGRARRGGWLLWGSAVAALALLAACGDDPTTSVVGGDAGVASGEAGTGQDAGSSTTPRCADGTWDHDGNPSTACVPWSKCSAGTYVTNVPSATVDRTCSGCATGTFSKGENAASCAAWSTCAAGTYVSTAGSATADRACTPCADGTHTSEPNLSACLTQNACPAGTEQTAAGTATSAPVCTACAAGTYCAGGAASKVACASGTWDHDGDAATACAAWTDCVAGQHVDAAGTATSDRTCTACVSGTFSTASNVATCTAWTDCAAGNYVSTPGSPTADRACTACADGTLTSGANESQCLPHDACAAGTVQTAAGTPTAHPVCDACATPGTYCAGGEAPEVPCSNATWDHDGNAATACVAWTNCVTGEHVDFAGSPMADRTCANCAAGSFSTASNVATCTTWQDCEAGSYVSVAGSTTTDRTCASCGDGTFTAGANEAQCQTHNACPAGTEQTTAGTPKADPVCADCADPGYYCPGGPTLKAPCANGTFDQDGNSATACIGWTSCAAGTEPQGGSTTTDRTCTACDPGFYSDDANTACKEWTPCGAEQYESVQGSTTQDRQCTNWSTCNAGFYVSTQPSPTQDRACLACDEGTYSEQPNQNACLSLLCPAGTVETTPGDADTAPVCVGASCVAGTYCAGGSTPKVDCGAGDYDDDMDSTTACTSWTTCSAPTHYMVSDGSDVADRQCDVCPDGQSTSEDNALACDPNP